MAITRMLVVFFDLPDAQTAVDVVLSALSTAANPFAIRFAVSQRYAAAFEQSDPSVLSRNDVRFFNEAAGLRGILPLLGDETHFLSLMGAYGFCEKWDTALYSRYRSLQGQNMLLTGTISALCEGLPPEAFLPALAQDFEPHGVLIERGLPLVSSAAPVPTLVIDPALLFGKVSFLREVQPERSALSIAAYVAKYTVAALDIAVIYPLSPLPERRLLRPVENVLPGTTLARFEQLAGFRYEQQRAGVKTTWGLFGLLDSYPQQLSHAMQVSQRARALRARLRGKLPPLLVSAFIDLPNPLKPIPAYILRFGFLKAIASLPLLLYTGGAQERLLRASFPNTFSYPDNNLLPKALLQSGMTREQHMRRSKLMLLYRAAQRSPEFTHVAWTNIDLLTHPICPQALPDFSPLMDERVHLATVNAIPDASFMVMPVSLLKLLVREVAAITHMDAELKRGFSEESLFERLVDKHPELFTLHKMPKKHLLFHTSFNPELLSQQYRRLLRGLPPPWQGKATIK